jgi:large exoprotein involved in heme utilization and adhesion
VNGSTGNGGNIAIDPQLVVLDNSDIIAQAVAGHDGNIVINANNFIASNDSLVSASSQLGISGTVDLVGPRVDLNGSLVVLPSDLRDAAEVARTSCDARARKQSSLVDAGHGGLPQDTETTIPALYVVNRDLRLDLAPAAGRKASGGAWPPSLPSTAHLTMGCG